MGKNVVVENHVRVFIAFETVLCLELLATYLACMLLLRYFYLFLSVIIVCDWDYGVLSVFVKVYLLSLLGLLLPLFLLLSLQHNELICSYSFIDEVDVQP